MAIHDHLIIGGLNLVGYSAEYVTKNAKIGMSIQRAFCNTGLGTEMMKYMLFFAKESKKGV